MKKNYLLSIIVAMATMLITSCSSNGDDTLSTLDTYTIDDKSSSDINTATTDSLNFTPSQIMIRVSNIPFEFVSATEMEEHLKSCKRENYDASRSYPTLESSYYRDDPFYHVSLKVGRLGVDYRTEDINVFPTDPNYYTIYYDLLSGELALGARGYLNGTIYGVELTVAMDIYTKVENEDRIEYAYTAEFAVQIQDGEFILAHC